MRRRWKQENWPRPTTSTNPTFLSVTPDGSRLYANSEVFTWREGTMSAYSFDRDSGTLSYLNKQSSLGSITAHNTITRDGTKLLVANYGMGEGGPDRAVAVHGFEKDGALSAPLASVSHSGTGLNTARQERSHAHSVTRPERPSPPLSAFNAVFQLRASLAGAMR